jgi:hypothetical protein
MPREPFDTISRKRTRIPSELMEEIEMTRTAHTDRTADLVGDLEAEFDSILAGHDANLDAAVEFGMRSARRRASTRNLMPWPDAKKIVDGFARDTDKLYDFLGKIEVAQRAAPDEETKKSIGRIYAKAYNQVSKFEADKKKAETALKRWGELVTGEKFQRLFQEVRMAVVKAKPNDPDGIDFEVEEFMNPGEGKAPYAVGRITIGPDDRPLYTIIVGYRAGTDEYWGDLKAGYSVGYTTFESIAAKAKGQTPRQFARKMIDMLIAYSSKWGAVHGNLFGSRRSLPSLMSSDLRESLLDELVAAAKTWGEYSTVNSGQKGLQSASYRLKFNYTYGRGIAGGLLSLEAAFKKAYNTALAAKTLPNWNRRAVARTVDTVSELQEFKFWGIDCTDLVTGRYGSRKFATWRNRKAKSHESLVAFATRTPSMKTLKKSFYEFRWEELKEELGLDRSPAEVQEAILNYKIQRAGRSNFSKGVTVDISSLVTFTVNQSRTASIARVADHHMRTAGSAYFEEYGQGGNPNSVFRRLQNEALHEHGHDYYGGHIGLKDGWKYETKTPVGSIQEASALANRVYNRYDKYGSAGCIPVAERQVKSSDKVTVKVKAINAKKAEAEGRLLIKATGPIRPRVKVTVENIKVKKVGGARTYPEWEVSGDRVQAVVGQVTGFLFFGWAPS